MTPAEIAACGVRLIEEKLRSDGYVCCRETEGLGETDILAQSPDRKILVRVHAAVAPAYPQGLSQLDTRSLLDRAAQSGLEAWLYQVQINNHRALVRIVTCARIEERRLDTHE